MQCNTSLSRRVDCGLWNVGPLLFSGCAKLLDIDSNWNTVLHTPIQSIVLTRVKTLTLSMPIARPRWSRTPQEDGLGAGQRQSQGLRRTAWGQGKGGAEDLRRMAWRPQTGEVTSGGRPEGWSSSGARVGG